MLMPPLIIYFLIELMQLLTGVFANGFIVVVNVTELIRQRQMAPFDLLISCLATSRICVQVTLFLGYLIVHSFIKQSVMTENFAFLMFVSNCELWLSTWLGVFYCAKIATIPHPLFFWLKRTISRLVPWLILGSVLYASVNTGIHVKYTWTSIQKHLANYLSKNATQTKELDIITFTILLIHFTVPTTVFLVAVLLSIFSLGRHTQQMRTIATGTRGLSSGAPIRAMLSILSFLILYCCNYMIGVLFFSEEMRLGSLLVLFCDLVAGTYPSIHSLILILGSPKLKQNAKRFLFCARCSQ